VPLLLLLCQGDVRCSCVQCTPQCTSMPDQPGVPQERPGSTGADDLAIPGGEDDRGSPACIGTPDRPGVPQRQGLRKSRLGKPGCKTMQSPSLRTVALLASPLEVASPFLPTDGAVVPAALLGHAFKGFIPPTPSAHPAKTGFW